LLPHRKVVVVPRRSSLSLTLRCLVIAAFSSAALALPVAGVLMGDKAPPSDPVLVAGVLVSD